MPEQSYIERLEQTPRNGQWAKAREWMFADPDGFGAELRRYRPVLATDTAVLVSRFHDCREILQNNGTFGVDLYKPKQGAYWMAQDNTPQHQREKGLMYAVLDREQLPDIRRFAAEEAKKILGNAGGKIEAINSLTRAVPIAVVQQFFGFDDADSQAMREWSYANQADAFHNQPFDAPVVSDPSAITAAREAANAKMRPYLIDLVQRRAAALKAGEKNTDMVSRLITLASSGTLRFDITAVVLNIGGLLIGTVETASQAAAHAIDELLSRPDVFKKAAAAASEANPEHFDGYVFEALRFKPIAPHMFRVCNKPATLAKGTDYATDIKPGANIVLFTRSAMFDDTAYTRPDIFDASRPQENNFLFGAGPHECLGKAIASVMLPEIVRQCLLLPGLKAEGNISYEGKLLPEKYVLSWNHGCG